MAVAAADTASHHHLHHHLIGSGATGADIGMAGVAIASSSPTQLIPGGAGISAAGVCAAAVGAPGPGGVVQAVGGGSRGRKATPFPDELQPALEAYLAATKERKIDTVRNVIDCCSLASCVHTTGTQLC